MLIVIAPDSFKSTATAAAAARVIAQGVAEVLPHATIKQVPMADGGEGTAEVIAQTLAASNTGPRVEKVELPATDARGRLNPASYFLHGDTASIDIAVVCGLPSVDDDSVASNNDTNGTGVVIADTQTHRAQLIILGRCGSATVDGCMGIITSMGRSPLDARCLPPPKGGDPPLMLV